MGGMTNINADRDTLRALADEGNEKALDRLADLADQREDLEELSDLLDEGCMRRPGVSVDRPGGRADMRAGSRTPGTTRRKTKPTLAGTTTSS